MEKKEQTPEEKREGARAYALRNLTSSHLTDLAAAYFVEENKQYGEAGSSAVEQFKYLPALQSKEGQKIVMENLLGSRQEGKRYSGNVSEYKIISDSAKIIQESLATVKVEDILKLMNSKIALDSKYQDKYVSELDKKGVEEIIGSYLTYFTDIKVSESLGQRANSVRSGLEDILKEPEKEAK